MKELQEKHCSLDTTAVAAILSAKGKTIYIYDKRGFFMNHIFEFRVKIYKKSGLDWATVKVPYYVGFEDGEDDYVTFSDCTTYNLEGNDIVKTKLKKEGIFDSKINEDWKEASITMPNVKEGSVIEYKYVIKSYNFTQFPTFYFQFSIPTNFAEYKTEIPEFFVYAPITTGFVKISSKSEVGFGYQNFDNEYNQGLNMSYKQINSVHTGENVPALKEENFIDNLTNYRATIEYELQKTRFPEVPEKPYTVTWDDVARTIYKEEKFGKELDKKGSLINDLRLILKDNDSTELMKATTVFRFVQAKMNWNNDYGYLTDKGVLKAYEEGSGNVAEINFILISMLNYAGIRTHPVLTSTIGHGIPIYPNRTVFNYVIAAAEIDGKRMLMDATSKFTTIDILPFHVLNWVGRLISRDGTSENVELLPTAPSKDVNNVIAVIDNRGNVNGKIRRQRTGYEALKFRDKYGSLPQDSYLEDLETVWRRSKIENYLVENKLTNLSNPVTESFNFSFEENDRLLADKMYINPMLCFGEYINPFNEEKRVLPLYFGYPKHTRYSIIVDIPTGYEAEFIPKSMSISIPEKLAIFTYKIGVSDSKIQVVANLENNGTILSASYYEDFKEFFKKVIEKQSERIILKKI